MSVPHICRNSYFTAAQTSPRKEKKNQTLTEHTYSGHTALTKWERKNIVYLCSGAHRSQAHRCRYTSGSLAEAPLFLFENVLEKRSSRKHRWAFFLPGKLLCQALRPCEQASSCAQPMLASSSCFAPSAWVAAASHEEVPEAGHFPDSSWQPSRSSI